MDLRFFYGYFWQFWILWIISQVKSKKQMKNKDKKWNLHYKQIRIQGHEVEEFSRQYWTMNFAFVWGVDSYFRF